MSRRPVFVNSSAAGQQREPVCINGLEQFHRSLPGYAPTPLVPLRDLATELGVRAVFVKDESDRFGLPSFKVLGASWGCYRAIAAYLDLPSTMPLNELSTKAQEKSTTLVAATEGNHGRAVAFMARLLDIKAQIFVPQHMDNTTRNLIAKEGANVIVVPGDYNEAVKQGAEASKQVAGALLIQDTAFEGYEDVPAWIVEGYSTMLAEIEDHLAQLGLVGSVMVTPVGVGSLAHAVARHCKSKENTMAVVAVEPDSAPCLSSSLNAGQSITVRTGATIMDGMNCGTLSATAWSDLQQLVDACVTVSCYEAHRAVQYLSSHSIPAGPCGGASLAAIRHLATSKDAPSILNKDSVVVLLATEGTRDYQIPQDVSIDDAVSLTQALTCIDSSNPTLSVADGAGETQIVNYLASWFAHRDIEYHKIESVAGRPSIVGIIRGSGGGQSLMFNGHVDTVSLSSYEKDPLSGSIGTKDDKEVVFGRGSLDMKGGLAAALAAMSAIKAGDHVPRGDVIVAAVADEEDASQGTQDVLAAGWRADAAIVAEPTGGTIATAHKGFLWVEVDIFGIAAHGSRPDEGEDAIIHSGWFLRALEQYQRHLPVDDTLGQASLHCGLIRGGEEPSSYPGKCTITVEFRTIPCQMEEAILEDVNGLLSDISKENPRFRYGEPRVTLSRPTQKLATDHPLVEKTATCASTILGTRPAVQSVSFWCDAALLSQAGIPSIVYGPTGAGLHSKEEWVEVESLRQMEKVYLELVRQFCY
ncbi:Peptidase M20 [Penicillium lagena]|uniref:Peptidase M20 n=1 Tax=Penicillium lagena TaxID=94218 RepID=UPI00253FFA2B|nr:Peptidase M20 [Penicillium lagena]KAJ5606034.1 Peptidase M20 [Penicillium lagena]